ncbi:MAG: metalloregulator ArsR/SmtB family transcription factor, partial [Fodinibius sp.]|nr:metalloregulator ArsR/SmtB family transcription factor [Fodinibius sp.]
MARDVFHAIADSTRRKIIDLLADGSLSVDEIADDFDISRPAVSKHIKVLNECGLLVIHREGRKRYCRANLQELKQVVEWAEQYRQFWSQRVRFGQLEQVALIAAVAANIWGWQLGAQPVVEIFDEVHGQLWGFFLFVLVDKEV